MSPTSTHTHKWHSVGTYYVVYNTGALLVGAWEESCIIIWDIQRLKVKKRESVK